MLSGLAFVTSLLASPILANPLGSLQARQSNPNAALSCTSYYGACQSPAQKSSATAWCASLGYGSSVVTVTTQGTGTSIVRKTIISTATSFTATTTKTAPTFTSTIPVSKTTTLTTISTLNVTSTTSTVTVNAAGTIQTCGTYTATYLSASSNTSSSLSTSTTSTQPSMTSPSMTSPSMTSPSITSPSTSVSIPATTTNSAASICTNTAPPRVISGAFNSCPQNNLTTLTFQGCSPDRAAFKVSCGSDFYPSYDNPPPNYNPGPYKAQVNSLQDCIASCLYDNGANCGGVTLLTGPADGPRCYYRGVAPDFFNNFFTMDTEYPPNWGLPDNGGSGLYWTSAQRLNFAPAPNAPSQTAATATPTDEYFIPGNSIDPTYLPQCVDGDCDGYQVCPQDDNSNLGFNNAAGGVSTFHVSCGMDLLEQQGQRTNYWVWSESLSTCAASCMFEWGSTCGGVTFLTGYYGDYRSPNSLQIYQCYYRDVDNSPIFSNSTLPNNNAFDPTGLQVLVSAILTNPSTVPFKRNIDKMFDARDGYRKPIPRSEMDETLASNAMAIEKRQAVAKPACLSISSPVPTSSVCNCVIPSTTTTRTTTQTLVSQVTSTRTVVTTLKAVSTTTTTPIKTITKTVSTITSLRTRTTTSTFKTNAYTTTTGTWTLASTPASFYIVDSHNGVAMWPADADEIFYNVQYDDSPNSTDPPPTSFGLNGTQLIINDFVDMDVVVVGQPYNGTGAQVMAFDRRNAARPSFLSCKITALGDGTCPLSCKDPSSGGNISWTDASGLWYLRPPGVTGGTQFNSLVLQYS